MLNAIIRFSLRHRLLVLVAAVFLVAYGTWETLHLPIDVFPNLTRPRVTILTEAPGMSPEEVEKLITFPMETVLTGANNVLTVRSVSSVGLSVIYVEFDWGTDIYTDRQIVNERLQLISDRLPGGITPILAPISSIMGQILMIGMWSDETAEARVGYLPPEPAKALFELDPKGKPVPVSDKLRAAFQELGVRLPRNTTMIVDEPEARWLVRAEEQLYSIVESDGRFAVYTQTGPLEMRTLADWVIRRRLLTVPGVSQVFTIGGEKKQFQVLVDPDAMRRFGVTLAQIKRAVSESNRNATGGYLDQIGPEELLVRGLGRVDSTDDLEKLVIKTTGKRPIVLSQVARVVEAGEVKRGDSSAFVRTPNGEWVGGSSVVLTVNKQPKADTRVVTEQVKEALGDLQRTLPPDVRVYPKIYSQKAFIDRAIENVAEALRDGAILIVIILLLFLVNLRTTFITLTAIPLSIVITAIVFAVFGLGVNTMTLGGIAVAIGELVDDAIVDVENIFRRLKENRLLAQPLHPLLVVFRASTEVRNSVVFSTIIVILAFLPLFGLTGMEGRLFTPLGIAYIVSIAASLFVSLTVTPVLSYLLLRRAHEKGEERDGPLLRLLKWLFAKVIRLSLAAPVPILVATLAMVVVAGGALLSRERDFLPPFSEGSVQLNVITRPGTSLKTSQEIARMVEAKLRAIPEVAAFARRTGRAELDEHAMPVNLSEFIISFEEGGELSRAERLRAVRESVEDVPGIVTTVEQPLAHLISHMLSGVKAQIAIKLYGNDLEVLRDKAQEIKASIASVPGLADLLVEPQIAIPQLRIEVDREKLAVYGLTPGGVNEYLQTAMKGEVVSQVLLGPRKFDLLVRLDEPYRENLQVLRRLALELPEGGTVPLSEVARIYRALGPNTIKREHGKRRIVIQANTTDRGLVDVVEDIKSRVRKIELPTGYFVEYGGQFESARRATLILSLLFAASLVGIFLTLYTLFRSVNLSLQVMVALPMAFIGAVAAIVITGQTLTIANIIGFIALAGIASRNGILLINHYLHLVQFEGESWSKDMIIRAGLERLAPVLMTALTAALGMVPLALAAGEPGKEILYPVATVIIGGLISSTLLDFFVHPAMFWLFGMKSAQGVIADHEMEIPLEEEHQPYSENDTPPIGGRFEANDES